MIAEFDKIKITWPNVNVEQGGVFSYMYLGEYGEFVNYMMGMRGRVGVGT